MPDFVYLNGEFIPRNQAKVSVEDRGFLFGDGVYEVLAVHKTVMIDGLPHIKRLERSLQEVEISAPLTSDNLTSIIRELITRNNLENGTVYIQITRGVAKRAHQFPVPQAKQTVFIMTSESQYPEPDDIAYAPVRVITLPDIRWGRCDIKSISLLANCLAREQASRAGAYEAVLFDRNNLVTECAAANVWIITHKGELRSRHTDNAILNGICRNLTRELAHEEDLDFREEAFSLDDLMQAKEVFLTTTTPMIKPIGWVDGNPIGDGKIGPITKKLLTRYRERVFTIANSGIDT